MKLTEFQVEILSIVQNANGYFLSPYQICNALEEKYPDVWAQIVATYPSSLGNPQMGAGADIPYSPATYVAKALDYFKNNGAAVKKERFSCDNVEFNEIKPGFTGKVVSIWAWKN